MPNLAENSDELRIVTDLARQHLLHVERVERVGEGGSTRVYRVCCPHENFYLRVLPMIGAGFAAEALAHTLLRERGALVPEIIFQEHYHEVLQCSILITTQIVGQPLVNGAPNQEVTTIIQAAGRDLALINSLPVQGFGWIKRDSDDPAILSAEHITYRAFALEYIEDDLRQLRQRGLSEQEIEPISVILSDYESWLNVTQSWLAHGDFDVTHIYQQAGSYTGVIDFGEIRGADLYYDLAHFHLHDGETLPLTLLPWLLEGYNEVTPLPPNAMRHIHFTSLLIAIRALARFLNKRPNDLYHHIAWQAIHHDVVTLGRGYPGKL